MQPLGRACLAQSGSPLRQLCHQSAIQAGRGCYPLRLALPSTRGPQAEPPTHYHATFDRRAFTQFNRHLAAFYLITRSGNIQSDANVRVDTICGCSRTTQPDLFLHAKHKVTFIGGLFGSACAWLQSRRHSQCGRPLILQSSASHVFPFRATSLRDSLAESSAVHCHCLHQRKNHPGWAHWCGGCQTYRERRSHQWFHLQNGRDFRPGSC